MSLIFFQEKIKIGLELLTPLLVFLTPLFSLISAFCPFIRFPNKAIRGKFLEFKSIREEYMRDKISGSFALQNYLKTPLKPNEIEFILNSPDAYSILPRLKSAHGKYDFSNKIFTCTVRRKEYIAPLTGYILTSCILLFYIVYYQEIRSAGVSGEVYFTLLIMLLGALGPIWVISLMTIGEITDARHLEKITQKPVKKTSAKLPARKK